MIFPIPVILNSLSDQTALNHTEMASASSMSVDAKVPLLASASGTGAGVPHTLWRPQMQTFLMRHGIEDRDYAREIAQWRELASAVEADAEAEEQEAIRLVLAAGSSSSKQRAATRHRCCESGSEGEPQAPAVTDDQQKAKKRVADLIGRSRKAYGFLFAALPTDVRQLVADVPQGYAFGIWSFLEKKFRNTEQDSVMALWERLSTLSQEAEESFDAYKARVDSVIELLDRTQSKHRHRDCTRHFSCGDCSLATQPRC